MALLGGSVTSTWNGRLVSAPRRHDQQVLAPDQVLDLAEQRLVERVRAGVVEGQHAGRTRPRAAVVGAALTSASQRCRARSARPLPSSRRLRPAAAWPTASHRARSAAPQPLAPAPACRARCAPSALSVLVTTQMKVSSGVGLPLGRVEEQHQRLVGAELGLRPPRSRAARGWRARHSPGSPSPAACRSRRCARRWRRAGRRWRPRPCASRLSGACATAAVRAASRCCHSATRSWRSRTRAASAGSPLAPRAAICASEAPPPSPRAHCAVWNISFRNAGSAPRLFGDPRRGLDQDPESDSSTAPPRSCYLRSKACRGPAVPRWLRRTTIAALRRQNSVAPAPVLLRETKRRPCCSAPVAVAG